MKNNASKQAKSLRKKRQMRLIKEDTANPDNWDKDGVGSGKNLSVSEITPFGGQVTQFVFLLYKF